MDEPYSVENTAARERLRRVTLSLTDVDLQCPMPDEWSVATKLLHLAFWDYFCLNLLEKWKSTNPSTSSVDVDAVNSAVRALCTAIPPRQAIELACSAAEAVDRVVEQLRPEMRLEIEASGRLRLLRRFIHRHEHLDQIEKALRR
jgi:hypothetical protein